jgi:hypothetical protein
MADDVIWIVTDETVEGGSISGQKNAQDTGNPYADFEENLTVRSQRKGVPVAAEKLERGMREFVEIMGRVLKHTRESTQELAGMTLDEIELSVEVNGEGQLSLLGMGGKTGAKGAMTLKFKATKAP